MENKYNSMEALNKDLKIYKLEAEIAEQTFLNHWKNLRQGVKGDNSMPQLAWQTLRNVNFSDLVRSRFIGTLTGSAIELVIRKWLFKRKR